jgi:hypothetical protein
MRGAIGQIDPHCWIFGPKRTTARLHRNAAYFYFDTQQITEYGSTRVAPLVMIRCEREGERSREEKDVVINKLVL